MMPMSAGLDLCRRPDVRQCTGSSDNCKPERFFRIDAQVVDQGGASDVVRLVGACAD